MTFEVHEQTVGIGQADDSVKTGAGPNRKGEVLEDDYGISVVPDKFNDIVSGIDPSKFATVKDEVLRRGFGYGVNDKQGPGAARVSDDENQDENEDLDELALEAMDLSEGKGIIRGRNGRPPVKVFTVAKKLEFLPEVSFVPMEGRVDPRAARQTARALQPRNLIVLGGPKVDESDLKDEVTELAEAARGFLQGEVLTPTDGETCELDIGHAAYPIRLVDAPYLPKEDRDAGKEQPESRELDESKLGPCSVAYVDYIATGQKVAADGSIVLAPRSDVEGRVPTVYVSDGDVLLTDLRLELTAQGMKAAYSAHSGYTKLVVNEKIVVRKDNDSGQIHVEGPLCEDFYSVRRIVCGQFVNL